MSYLRKGEDTPIRTGRAARTRVGNHMSMARRQAVLTAQAGRVNSGRVTTADYLRRLGADDAFVNSYSSPYGRTVAKVYREQTGHEPAKSGLAVRGRRLVAVFAYGADDAAILEKAASTYARTAALAAERPAVQAEAPAAAVEGTAPAVLVAELAERYELAAGFAAQRVEAVLDAMRTNPRLYDPQRDLLTPGGAAVVRSVVHAEDIEGMLRREAEAWQDAEIAAECERELQEADRQLREALETGDYRAVVLFAQQAALAKSSAAVHRPTGQPVRVLAAA